VASQAEIQGWDSIDQLKGWYNSAEYQALLKIVQPYATFRRYAIVTPVEKN
jgi:uncharacterized protein (DUF1330 family)